MLKPCRKGERVANAVREASASYALLHGYNQNRAGVYGGAIGPVFDPVISCGAQVAGWYSVLIALIVSMFAN